MKELYVSLSIIDKSFIGWKSLRIQDNKNLSLFASKKPNTMDRQLYQLAS
jgi:hypothetical protein